MKCKYSAQAHEAMEQIRLSRKKTNEEADGVLPVTSAEDDDDDDEEKREDLP